MPSLPECTLQYYLMKNKTEQRKCFEKWVKPCCQKYILLTDIWYIGHKKQWNYIYWNDCRNYHPAFQQDFCSCSHCMWWHFPSASTVLPLKRQKAQKIHLKKKKQSKAIKPCPRLSNEAFETEQTENNRDRSCNGLPVAAQWIWLFGFETCFMASR